MRQNARDAYHDSMEAHAMVNRFADTVADDGLKLEPTPTASLLGLTPKRAEEWSEEVAERFNLWAKDKNAHRQGHLNFYQSQRLYQKAQHRDNDIFVRLYYSTSRKLLNPLQFQFIDPNQVRGYAWTSTYAQFDQNDGIIRDQQGREKAYKIWHSQNGKIIDSTIPRISPQTGRLFMLHGFVPDYAGQDRGYSLLGHALQEFENITDFSAAHIKKAINQSNITMYVKPSDDAPASDPLEVITHRTAGPPAAQYTSNPPPTEGQAGELGDPVSYCPIPEATLAVPGSVGVFNLERGEDLKAFTDSAPGANFGEFVDHFTTHLSASRGMPAEVLLMKFQSNYSASRAALVMFWRIANMWREEMASDYLNPTYSQWLAEEIAATRISAPGWSDPVLRAAWLNCNWIGSPMPNIDPVKESVASAKNVELGRTTLDRESRDLNGSSGKANRAKLAREFAELPLAPWSNAAIAKNNNQGGA
jgi:lambda family phage portal protein